MSGPQKRRALSRTCCSRSLSQRKSLSRREALTEPRGREEDDFLLAHDAALLIGDPALKVDRSQYQTWDLADEWNHFTGKPFVFAFWAVTENAAKETRLDLATIFQQSRDHGLLPANLAQIVATWAAKLGLSEVAVCQYLTENIHYYLDESCLDGLRLFYRYASECGALPAAPALRFLDVAKIAAT
jgi:chorismate dehydratase